MHVVYSAFAGLKYNTGYVFFLNLYMYRYRRWGRNT